MRHFSPVLFVLLMGLAVSGCNERHRYQPPVPSPDPAPDPEPELVTTPKQPPEEIGGFLATEHHAESVVGAHPIEEPWAPPGRWVPARNDVHVWIPNFARHLETAIIAEVETTIPKHDRLYSVEPGWVGPRPGTRLIVLPGAFQVRVDSGAWALAAGLAALDTWHVPAPEGRPITEGVTYDVLYLAWRPQASGPYLPALAHELAHSWSRSWLGEGPPGVR